MALDWCEWKCPYCRRVGQVNPAKDYEDGETVRMNCPCCGAEVVVVCCYEPAFIAYKSEHWRGDAE